MQTVVGDVKFFPQPRWWQYALKTPAGIVGQPCTMEFFLEDGTSLGLFTALLPSVAGMISIVEWLSSKTQVSDATFWGQMLTAQGHLTAVGIPSQTIFGFLTLVGAIRFMQAPPGLLGLRSVVSENTVSASLKSATSRLISDSSPVVLSSGILLGSQPNEAIEMPTPVPFNGQIVSVASTDPLTLLAASVPQGATGVEIRNNSVSAITYLLYEQTAAGEFPGLPTAAQVLERGIQLPPGAVDHLNVNPNIKIAAAINAGTGSAYIRFWSVLP